MWSRIRSCELGVFSVVLSIAGPAWTATTSVSTSGSAFSPANVTIDAGDTVEWTIGVGHNVVETTGAGTCAEQSGGFRSGASASDTSVRSFSHVFSTPGTYYYKCNVHCGAGMRGTVTVLAEVDSGSGGDPVPGGDPRADGESSAVGDDPRPSEGSSGGDASPSLTPRPDAGGGGCSGAHPASAAALPVGLAAPCLRRRFRR